MNNNKGETRSVNITSAFSFTIMFNFHVVYQISSAASRWVVHLRAIITFGVNFITHFCFSKVSPHLGLIFSSFLPGWRRGFGSSCLCAGFGGTGGGVAYLEFFWITNSFSPIVGGFVWRPIWIATGIIFFWLKRYSLRWWTRRQRLIWIYGGIMCYSNSNCFRCVTF